ncbi:MAG: PIN domain-containing protein [Cellulomonas sp.]|jgi:predicted nucleic acid-binding protein|nr:PIN domain-containing protein [Cellulomonas sp.]
MTRLQRVFIDTSELFPFTVMDVLLTQAEDRLYDWVWTDEVLDEWQEVIVREGRRTSESAASAAAAVRSYFGRFRIDPALYRDKITDDLSPDPDDRVHAAAAIHGDVDVLLTRNMKHLNTKPVLAAGVKVISSDDFLADLLKRRRRGVVESFTRAASGKKNPPVTVQELADRIAAAGAPKFAERLRPLLPGG